MRFFILLPIIFMLSAHSAYAFDSFTVKDIRVEGLQRISIGTVLSNLPIKVNDQISDQETIRQAIRSLYREGLFHDVSLERDGNALIVIVRERPSIAEIKTKGNKAIEKNDIEQALKLVGLVEGRVFNRSILERVEQELRAQYFERGKYSAKVDATVTPLERNRVSIAIDINEGEDSRVRSINIIGNDVFSEKRLLAQMNLGTYKTYLPWSDADKYSKQKLAADLESLRSFYFDRGYVDYKLISSQVSITPDRMGLFVTLNISEGEQYKFGSVTIANNDVVPSEELESLLEMKQDDVFSRKSMAESSSAIQKRIAEEGYTFATAEPFTRVDSKNRTVSVDFRINPGSRIYVRRITTSNNVKTRDDIIRRELRQTEGALLSTEKVNISRQRLMRLGYFENVNITETRVSGVSDQVDLNIDVTEGSTGTLSGGISYSPENGGLAVNLSTQQNNVLGTGTSLGITINEGETSNIYSISYTDPYSTDSGISRSISLYSRTYDSTQLDTATYATNNEGLSVSYGLPINELNTMNVGYTYENTLLTTTATTPQEILDFESSYQSPYYLNYLTLGWKRDNRNNAIFATAGSRTQISLKTTIPGDSLEFYKLNLSQNNFLPIGKHSTVRFKGTINYGGTFGGTTTYPVFENFYTGGPESIRGFWPNRLGPKGTDGLGDPVDEYIGGAFETLFSLEYLFPPSEDSKSTRVGVFVDAGNVFSSAKQYTGSELRVSAGVGMVWLLPFGALKLSYAVPLAYDETTDTLQPIQFSIGLPY
ncbi:MAG: outer membrane protein assembly factor BamA [Gammaproteobacteria bacterium]|nr:outer membrane protein assembly factor BamA [Gammaproteobacteria bacterium]